MRKYLEQKYLKITYQNLWEETKEIMKEKFNFKYI